MKAAVATTCLSLLAGAISPAGAKDLPKVLTVDGESFAGELTSIARGEAIFRTPAGSRSVPLAALWSVRFAGREDLMTRPGKQVIALAGEGRQRLAIRRLSIREGKISASTTLLGDVGIEMSAIAAIYLPRTDQLPQTCRRRHLEMKLPPASHDYLVAQDRSGNWVPVPGVLKSIAARRVGFEFEGKDRQIDLGAVRAIELARMAGERASPGGYLVGRDGSVVGFRSVRMAGSALSLEIEGIEAKPVGLHAVAEIRFVSDRCVHLSALTPSKVAQAGLFDVAFGFRRDRSTAGGPLSVGQVRYAKGIGLHSRCALTYSLGGEYATFAATAGIDDGATRRGNATLRLIGDGKDLLKPVKLVGGTAPVAVRCDLSGVKELTIRVDFGDDHVDVGDHVSLAEARLIKP